VEEEIGRIREEGVPEKQLLRARAYLRAARLRQLESSRARAMLLGQYELLDGDPGLLNTELNILSEVTAEQIQEAARRYLVATRRSVLEIVPEPAPGGDAAEEEPA
jgi:zinc protease